MRTVGPFCWTASLLLGVMTWNAYAAVPAPTPTPTPAHDAGVNPSAPRHVAGMGESVGSAALAKLSGGTDISERMTLNGSVTDNSADHVTTGSNAINSGSFNGAAGLPMIIQNTGNNVLIQNATIVNVQLQP